MKTVSIHEAKAQLSGLISAAEKGERVVLSRYGKPVVELASYKARKRSDFPENLKVICNDPDYDLTISQEALWENA